MIRFWHRAAFVAVLAVFCLFVVRWPSVTADLLYDLDNMITNGDMSVDSNSDGIADYWNVISGTGTLNNGIQKATGNNTGASVYLSHSVTWITGHKYYIYCGYLSYVKNALYYSRFYATGTATSYTFFNTTGTYDHYNDVWTSTLTGSGSIYFVVTRTGGGNVDNTNSVSADNIMIVDLTATFGSGYEPTLADFEAYYLPDLEYFDDYSSYYPENELQLDVADYVNLGDDVGAIEWSKALISQGGTNMSIEIYAKLNSTGAANYYVNGGNIPEVLINGRTFTAEWTGSDYSNYVIELDMSADFENAFKDVLFNHYINPAEEYINFRIESFPILTSDVTMWMVISLDYPLNIDVKSFLVSMDRISYGFLSIADLVGFRAKMYDQNNALINPVIELRNPNYDELGTYLIDDFGDQYTNVSRFDFHIGMMAPDKDDDPPYVDLRFYEVNMFAQDDIIHIDVPDTDLDPLFPTTVCEWYEFGCHAKNIINEIGAYVYNTLEVDQIVATVNDITGTVSNFFEILPDEIIAMLVIVLTGLAGYVIFILIDRFRG